MQEIFKQLFSSKTAHGRVLRTIVQVVVGLSGGLLFIFNIPEMYDLFEKLPLWGQIGGLAAFVGFVSLVQNYGAKLLDWLKDK